MSCYKLFAFYIHSCKCCTNGCFVSQWMCLNVCVPVVVSLCLCLLSCVLGRAWWVWGPNGHHDWAGRPRPQPEPIIWRNRCLRQNTTATSSCCWCATDMMHGRDPPAEMTNVGAIPIIDFFPRLWSAQCVICDPWSLHTLYSYSYSLTRWHDKCWRCPTAPLSSRQNGVDHRERQKENLWQSMASMYARNTKYTKITDHRSHIEQITEGGRSRWQIMQSKMMRNTLWNI